MLASRTSSPFFFLLPKNWAGWAMEMKHFIGMAGSMQVSEKLTTYPSPNLILTLSSHFGQNVGLGER